MGVKCPQIPYLHYLHLNSAKEMRRAELQISVNLIEGDSLFFIYIRTPLNLIKEKRLEHGHSNLCSK